MERSSPGRMQLRPHGPWSIQSLRPTTGLAPTSAAAGGRKRLIRSFLRTAVGATPTEFGKSLDFEWFDDDFVRFQEDGVHGALHIWIAADQQRKCMGLRVAHRADHRESIT